MKKTFFALLLCISMLVGSVPVYANNSYAVAANEAAFVRYQADALIAQLDAESLCADAVAGTVDYSVPLSIRESVVASAQFTPLSGVAQDAVDLKVTSTVKKVGEITRSNGETSNLYVSVAAASQKIKLDEEYESKHGIKAWAAVYWIDNPGSENELHAAGGRWDPQDKAVSNRELRYGTTDILVATWVDGPTERYPTSNEVYYEDPGRYIGLTLRCQTKIDVAQLGTVTCNVGNRIIT